MFCEGNEWVRFTINEVYIMRVLKQQAHLFRRFEMLVVSNFETKKSSSAVKNIENESVGFKENLFEKDLTQIEASGQ